ncbi:MAG TPA: TolC family protein, partial [Caproiciproducens sp.]|nr:TolC family protein [Caproiciproducens sp.]
GYQMNQLLGHPYNDLITFGPLPEPDSGYVTKINLSSDVTAAQESSYKVQIYNKQRSILSDDTAANREKRQIMSNNAEMERQNVGASLEKQYAAIKKQQTVLATEQQKLTNAKLRLDQAQKQFNAGVLSAMKLNKAKNDYFTEQAALKTASATLFWNIESYKWIVKGLPAA